MTRVSLWWGPPMRIPVTGLFGLRNSGRGNVVLIFEGNLGS